MTMVSWDVCTVSVRYKDHSGTEQKVILLASLNINTKLHWF